MSTSQPEPADNLIEDAIPPTPKAPVVEPIDLSAPWYRPAKQFLRRQQWNGDILHLLNKRPRVDGESTVLKYVGLPGQHYLDVMSMGAICNKKHIIIDYLGFRTGTGDDVTPQPLAEVTTLSNYRNFTPNSNTWRDSVANINQPETFAGQAFDDRGTFDVVNLDVCGGILHGEKRPLLNAIKYVLTSQLEHPHPWLLFVTTTALAADIEDDARNRFFSTIQMNCTRVPDFKAEFAKAAERFDLDGEVCLTNTENIKQDTFLRLFTLAFGKWLLSNLSDSTPRSIVSLRSVYGFRNTNQPDAEMLSLAYLITPIRGGGADMSELTTPTVKTQVQEYSECAVKLISGSMDHYQDLDHAWKAKPVLRDKTIAESEALLRKIGVDDGGIANWRIKHNLPAVSKSNN